MSIPIRERATRTDVSCGWKPEKRMLSILMMSVVLGSCTQTGLEANVEDTPESRWQALDPAATITIASGALVVGSVLPEPVSVLLTDKRGRPFSNLSVVWEVSDLGGGIAEVGDDPNFTATLTTTLDAEGRASVRWKLGTVSGDQSIGVSVTGPGSGRAKRVTRDFQVIAEAGTPVGMSITPARSQVIVSDVEILTASLTDEYGNDATDTPITWSSMDEAVAAVDGSGVVTAMAPGTAVVSATAGTITEAAMIQVEADTATTASGTLNLSPRALTRGVGQSARITVNAVNATGDPVTPSSRGRRLTSLS